MAILHSILGKLTGKVADSSFYEDRAGQNILRSLPGERRPGTEAQQRWEAEFAALLDAAWLLGEAVYVGFPAGRKYPALEKGFLRANAKRAAEGAFTRMQLNIMDLCTDGYVGQGQAVACFCLCGLTAHNLHAVGQPGGGKDIGFLPVLIADQSDVGAPVGVILDTDNRCRNPILAVPLEINDPVFSLGAASAVPNGNLALVVPASVLF